MCKFLLESKIYVFLNLLDQQILNLSCKLKKKISLGFVDLVDSRKVTLLRDFYV
jgi:hypothetical protein